MNLAPAALALIFALGATTWGGARAVESDPLPVPQTGASARAVAIYNDGVSLLLSRQYAQAQEKFEAALAIDELLAEAHNNLAFALRMQGAHNFDRSLKHYDRAIALKPALAQAYMYRGVLLTQRGDLARARQDLDQLKRLDAKLARELQQVMEGRTESGSSGIASQYD